MSDPNSGVVLGGMATLSQVHLSERRGAGGRSLGVAPELERGSGVGSGRGGSAGRGDIGILHHSDERGVGRLRKS